MNTLRYLVIGAVGSLGLHLAAAYFGPVGMLLNLLVSLPLAYAAMRGGLMAGVLGALLATTIQLASLGVSPAVAFAAQFAFPPLVLVTLMKKGLAWDRAVAAATLVVLLVASVGLFAYTSGAESDAGSVIEGYIQGEINLALSMAEQGEFDAGQKAEYTAVVEQMGEFLRQTYPAWAVLVIALLLVIQVLVLFRFAGTDYQIPGQPFRGWKAPEYLVWLLILSGFVTVFGGGIFRLIGLNGLVVLLPIYFLQGLAVVTFFFLKKGIPPFLRGVGYLLIAVLNPLPIIVTGIGVFDLWADFRKPRLTKT